MNYLRESERGFTVGGHLLPESENLGSHAGRGEREREVWRARCNDLFNAVAQSREIIEKKRKKRDIKSLSKSSSGLTKPSTLGPSVVGAGK